jgi:uncharacterized RDD family membrane protein YckC
MAEYQQIEHQPAPRLNHDVVSSRIIAAIIDLVLLVIVYVVLIALAGDVERQPDGTREYSVNTGQVFLGLAIWHAYYFAFEGLIGASLGKLLMGLQVVDATGQPCGMGRALVRNLVRFIDNLFLFIPGLVCMLLTPTHQRIGDLAAGTLVVRS